MHRPLDRATQLTDGAPPALLTGIVTNGATAFLIIMAMTLGLILPRMLFERFSSGPA